MKLTIRRARHSDAAEVERLYRILVPGDDTVTVLPERLATIEEDTANFLFVAENGHGICATVLVSLCSDVMYRDQPFAVVENLVVAPAVRGQGVGGQLMAFTETFCAEKDCSKIMLLSTASRVDAHRFFEAQGFKSDLKRGFVKYRRGFTALPADDSCMQ